MPQMAQFWKREQRQLEQKLIHLTARSRRWGHIPKYLQSVVPFEHEHKHLAYAFPRPIPAPGGHLSFPTGFSIVQGTQRSPKARNFHQRRYQHKRQILTLLNIFLSYRTAITASISFSSTNPNSGWLGANKYSVTNQRYAQHCHLYEACAQVCTNGDT